MEMELWCLSLAHRCPPRDWRRSRPASCCAAPAYPWTRRSACPPRRCYDHVHHRRARARARAPARCRRLLGTAGSPPPSRPMRARRAGGAGARPTTRRTTAPRRRQPAGSASWCRLPTNPNLSLPLCARGRSTAAERGRIDRARTTTRHARARGGRDVGLFVLADARVRSRVKLRQLDDMGNTVGWCRGAAAASGRGGLKRPGGGEEPGRRTT